MEHCLLVEVADDELITVNLILKSQKILFLVLVS